MPVFVPIPFPVPFPIPSDGTTIKLSEKSDISDQKPLDLSVKK